LTSSYLLVLQPARFIRFARAELISCSMPELTLFAFFSKVTAFPIKHVDLQQFDQRASAFHTSLALWDVSTNFAHCVTQLLSEFLSANGALWYFCALFVHFQQKTFCEWLRSYNWVPLSSAVRKAKWVSLKGVLGLVGLFEVGKKRDWALRPISTVNAQRCTGMTWRLKYCLLFCMGVKLGSSHWERNTDWAR
jgi:hypothetical protein